MKNAMVGEQVWTLYKGRTVKMVVIESTPVWTDDRKGVELVMHRPNGAIYYEGFLAQGESHVAKLRESKTQDASINRSLRRD